MAEPTTATASRDPSTLSASFTPTGTRDSAPGSNNDDDANINTGGGKYSGMASYYFVFLVLTFCIIGVVIFLNFRRRRKRRLQMLHGLAMPQNPAQRGRRHWQARWGSQNVSREEGLNEHGEAPPPYVPKRSGEDVRGSGEGGQAADGGPAMPMQTLSREEAGLKPPDYEEARADDDGEDVMRPAHRAEAAGSSSRQA